MSWRKTPKKMGNKVKPLKIFQLRLPSLITAKVTSQFPDDSGDGFNNSEDDDENCADNEDGGDDNVMVNDGNNVMMMLLILMLWKW